MDSNEGLLKRLELRDKSGTKKYICVGRKVKKQKFLETMWIKLSIFKNDKKEVKIFIINILLTCDKT